MRSLFRVLFLFLTLPALVVLTGCEANNNNADEWNDNTSSTHSSVNNNTSSSNEGSSYDQMGEEQEEVIRDTAYEVVERRQRGGQLIPSGEVSSFDGRPRMTRAPIESMIIVQGNMTGQQAAYLIPAEDYNVVRVGHRLQESTLHKEGWESASINHIPPPPPPPESPLRSRTGGAAENLVY